MKNGYPIFGVWMVRSGGAFIGAVEASSYGRLETEESVASKLYEDGLADRVENIFYKAIDRDAGTMELSYQVPGAWQDITAQYIHPNDPGLDVVREMERSTARAVRERYGAEVFYDYEGV